MSWFPDGEKLAYVQFVARKDIPASGVRVEDFGRGHYTGNWPELPAIHILDIQSGETRFLSLGWIPVVSADGKTVFTGGWVSDSTDDLKLVWRSVDVSSGAAARLTWPGDAGGLIANPSDDLVLYWGLPTAGAKIQQLTIKLAVLDSGRFQTVIPTIDPRNPISFGRLKRE